jgi:aminoglycoside phosphotransferase (APT) family kinase protein
MTEDEMVSWLEKATQQSVTVTRFAALAGGASMETWSVDATIAGVHERLVIRRDMGASMWSESLTRAQEFSLLQRALASGVKVPVPRWLHEGAGEGDRSFFVMDRVDGESVGRRVVKLPELATARRTMAREMGEQLAKIHAIATEDFPWLPRPAAHRSTGEHALDRLRATMDTLQRDHPVWEYAMRRLARRVPPSPSVERTLVHGDFRVGNLLVAPSGLAAVIDWEFAHMGDRHEDLSWPTMRDWRFEKDALTVGGVGSLDDMLEGYAAAGGKTVDRTALVWWEIVGNLRWSVTCHSQAERHLSGKDRSVELASLGRKSAEIEWEILHLIDERTREGTL